MGQSWESSFLVGKQAKQLDARNVHNYRYVSTFMHFHFDKILKKGINLVIGSTLPCVVKFSPTVEPLYTDFPFLTADGESNR